MTAVRRHWLAIATATAALAAMVASSAPAPTAIRAPLVLAFAVLGPGAALVPLIGLRDAVGECALAIGVSCALDVVVALGMVYAGIWSPEAGLAILVALTLAGAGAQVMVARRQP